jgi:hypothetical protein
MNSFKYLRECLSSFKHIELYQNRKISFSIYWFQTNELKLELLYLQIRGQGRC